MIPALGAIATGLSIWCDWGGNKPTARALMKVELRLVKRSRKENRQTPWEMPAVQGW